MTVTQGNTVVNWTIAQGATLGGLNAEISARQEADTALQASITTEVTNRTNAVSAEANSRASADTILQDNIDLEEAARIAADSVLSGQITALQNRVPSISMSDDVFDTV